MIEVLLSFFSCVLYFKYWYYKYGKVVYKEMPNQIGMDNSEDKTVMIVLIDIVIFIALFLNIIFSAIIFAISVNYIDNDIDRIFAVLRVIPFSLIYIYIKCIFSYFAR